MNEYINKMTIDDSGLTRNMFIHSKHLTIKRNELRELKKLGFTFDGDNISATLYFKSHFDRAVRALDKTFLEWECSGNFTIGLYIETKWVLL